MRCSRLVDVNSGECLSLVVIRPSAFFGCWELRESVVPESCKQVDVRFCGIASLDIHRSEATFVHASGCHHMRKLCLPDRVACNLQVWLTPALQHLSFRVWPQGNDWNWGHNTRPEEMRLFAQRAAPALDGAGACCLSNARVFADIGAVGVRQSRPALPC
jgi:hypothetical protein